ncbi:MAG TPA: prolyl oligopeptidase family serine peptidase [Gemmataceae bacterium]|nr:prolyl oligopeptidase family serine peptidase [Gemmataceae bacterium]
MHCHSGWAALALCGLLALSLAAAGDGPIRYPETRRGDQVDVYHGTRVADPYRWLEDDVRRSSEVAAWVAAQNKVTSAYLNAIPQREAIRKRLTELWDYPRYSAPHKEGGRYFFSKNDGLQNQSVLYTMEALDGTPRVLLDPNKWSKDGTVALAGMAFSDDGKYLVYGVAEAGSDWTHWKALDVASGKVLDDEIKWVKFGGASWTRDDKGFYYSRFPEPKPGEKFQGLPLNQKLYYHKLGAAQGEDALVYEVPDHPRWTVHGAVTDDGRYLLLDLGDGTTSRRNRVLYKDLAKPDGKFVPLIDNFDSRNYFIDNVGPVFYFQTDLNAPRGKVVAIDLAKPAPENWKEIVPEAKESLESAHLVGGQLIAVYLKDAKSQVKVFTPEGKFRRDLELPGICSASGFGGKRTDQETFYTVTSFATPPSIFRLDLKTGKSSLFRRSEVKFNPDDYEVKQVFYASKDGTKVPMFLSYKKGVKPDGGNPTLLYGYGGFNISLTPAFSVTRLAWMEMGGVFALANLRGGGEYGQEWHKAGTKLHKQNVFDDFIAAAQWLIDNKYTRTDKLAIQGGSNGGLLVGAVMTQRPDLFGACLPAVGVMDMLRFQKFTAGRFWVDDYGSSDDAAEFKALYAYSPLHTILRHGRRKYPATLVTTADTDDRVVPGHSFKFIAALQWAQTGPAPVLARIETRAGHGAGKPTAKQIEEVADQWAFLVKNLDMKVP